MENIFKLTNENINNKEEWPDWLIDIPSSVTTNDDWITINFSGGRKLQAEIGDFIVLDKNNKITIVEGYDEQDDDSDDSSSFEEVCQRISEIKDLDQKEEALILLGERLLHTISPADENMDENLQSLSAEARFLENQLENLYITAARSFYRYMIKHQNKQVEGVQDLSTTDQSISNKKKYH